MLSSTLKVRKFTTVTINQNPSNGEEATQQRPNVLNQNWVENPMGRLQIQRKSHCFQTSSFLLLHMGSLFTPSSFLWINFSFNFCLIRFEKELVFLKDDDEFKSGNEFLWVLNFYFIFVLVKFTKNKMKNEGNMSFWIWWVAGFF